MASTQAPNSSHGSHDDQSSHEEQPSQETGSGHGLNSRTIPPRDEIQLIRRSPGPWTALPFELMQGITGEELLVFYPNHALTWPAICERLSWEFPSYSRIAEIINDSSPDRVYYDGTQFVNITTHQVRTMIDAGRREFQLLVMDRPWETLRNGRIAVPYKPPRTWYLPGEQLRAPVPLAVVAEKIMTNPNFQGISDSSEFLREAVQAYNGYVRADPKTDAQNPPALPVGWNHGRAQIAAPLLSPLPIFARASPNHPAVEVRGYNISGQAPQAAPHQSVQVFSQGPSLALQPFVTRQNTQRPLTEAGRLRAEEPIVPHLLMSSLPPQTQRDTARLIELGMPSMNGEVILFLLNRYEGGVRMYDLALALTPEAQRNDAAEVKKRASRLTFRVNRALEAQAYQNNTTVASEKAYWRNHLATPPFGKLYTKSELGPPPREDHIVQYAPTPASAQMQGQWQGQAGMP